MNTEVQTQQTVRPVAEFFPLPTPREKQLKAMGFIDRAYARGYRNVVLAAPTGIGKTGIGIAACLWAGQSGLDGMLGGYYLVTQKLLQDQLQNDFTKFHAHFQHRCALLKSAVEYPCTKHGTCMVGGRQTKEKRCQQKRDGHCPYTLAYNRFCNQPVSVTNYPYFMTERTYVGQLKPRQVLIGDECHTIEKQILGFVDITIDRKSLEEWAPHLRPIPRMPSTNEFCAWLMAKYLPALQERLDYVRDRAMVSQEKKAHQELAALENHYGRIQVVHDGLQNQRDNWIYWQEEDDEDFTSVAKPIEAAPYTNNLIYAGAHLRLFMSAYPGPKNIFCRSVGLDPETVAWCSLASTFPVEHRPIHMVFVGSMGQRSIEQTKPRLFNRIDKILSAHREEKGVIHCHSYRLGQTLFQYLRNSEHAGRILFPARAEQRNVMLQQHSTSTSPTVLLSPSMTEGFSLDDALARWQIIAKVPYPYLGDRQVEAKKNRDPDWYAMQTAMTLIQACGRIVRSDTDWGVTYIVDSDFQVLFERHPDFFPPWFQQAFQWHGT